MKLKSTERGINMTKVEAVKRYKKELKINKADLQKWFECLQKNLIAKDSGIEYVAIEYIEQKILKQTIIIQRLEEIIDKFEFEIDMEA